MNSTTLSSTLDDLADVTEFLLDMERIQIYHLGVVLGLRQNKVEDWRTTPDIPILDKVIAAWLRKEDKVTEKGEPSWTVLIKALKHPRVGQTGIANNIAKKQGLL